MQNSNTLLEVFKWSYKNILLKDGYIVEDTDNKAIQYRILEKLDMYRSFINININNDEQIISFIKKYGFLEQDIFIRESLETSKECGPYKESINKIKDSILKFKQIVDLYAFLNNTNYHNDLLEIKIRNLESSYLDNITCIKRDLALENLHTNNEIENKINTMNIITTSVNKYVKKVIRSAIIYKDSEGNPYIGEKWLAPDLITAMYYMFYLAMINKRIIRKCQNVACNKFFSLESGHLNKKYCDNKLCARPQTVRNWRMKNKK